MTQPTFIVVGAGQAGGQAIRELRRLGFEGRLVLVGAEDSYPYERPQLSKALLQDPVAALHYVGTDVEFRDRGIEFLCNTSVLRIDTSLRTVDLSDGQTLAYDRLLIATGSTLRRIAIPGLAADKIAYLRTLAECRDLEARLRSKPKIAIVGGGFIGLEVAASARKLGCEVSVLAASSILLPRLKCPQASDTVLRRHRGQGIEVLLNAKISEFRDGVLICADGRSVAADLVVAGIGVVPETSVAERAGLAVNDGLVVDAHARTSDPFIFAAGDVTRQFHPFVGATIRLESWENANLQAASAARAMMGLTKAESRVQAPWVWSDQGDLNLQVAGVPNQGAISVVREFPDDPGSLIVFQMVADTLRCVVTINRGKDMVLLRRLFTLPDLRLDAQKLADPAVSARDLLRA